jgi:hypothetical protein
LKFALILAAYIEKSFLEYARFKPHSMIRPDYPHSRFVFAVNKGGQCMFVADYNPY